MLRVVKAICQIRAERQGTMTKECEADWLVEAEKGVTQETVAQINITGRDLVTQEFRIPSPEEILVTTDADFVIIDKAAKEAVTNIIAELKLCYLESRECVIRGHVNLDTSTVSENLQLSIVAKIKEIMLGANWHVESCHHSSVASQFYYKFTVKSLKSFREHQATEKLSRCRKIKLWSCVGTALIMTLLGLLVYFV